MLCTFSENYGTTTGGAALTVRNGSMTVLLSTFYQSKSDIVQATTLFSSADKHPHKDQHQYFLICENANDAGCNSYANIIDSVTPYLM